MQESDEDYDGKFKVSLFSLLKANATEWRFLLIGCFGAGLYGAYPIFFATAFGGFTDVSMVRRGNEPACGIGAKDDSIQLEGSPRVLLYVGRRGLGRPIKDIGI